MDESQQIPSETTEEWVFDFHGTSYIVCVTVSSRVLTIQIEDEQHGDRWSADFTAQYIEEITQKAGNYKKFHVFTTMLTSAFAKNSDSVYVDLLTLSDIEVLKAKKTGGQIPSATGSLARNDALRRSHNHKRYLVLTYTGEFDRVHYPLPLSFEETPNAIALQKTIKRLREKLKEKRIADLEPASDREKELRQIVAQLRQDNTELRHRLRHSGNKAHVASTSHSNNDLSMLSHMSPGTQTLINADFQAMNNSSGQNHYLNNAELVKENIKLRKTNDDLKLKLKEHVALLEKLKNDHQRERIKWQNRLGGVSLVDAAVSDHSHKLKTRAEEQLMSEMKKKIAFLEKELKMERLSRGRPSVTHSSVQSSGTGGFTNSNNRSLSASSGGRGRGTVGRGGVSRSPSPSLANNNNVISSSRIKRTSTGNNTANYATSNSAGGRRHSSPSVTQSQSHRYQSPYRQQTTQVSSSPSNNHNYYSSSSYNYNNTMSPSSSLGGRFDPTAYQRAKETQKTLKSQQNRYKSSSKDYNYNSDSGYSSAGSSTHSHRSVRSQRSDTSQTKKTRKSTSKHSDDYLYSENTQKNKSLVQRSVSPMTSSKKSTKKKTKSANYQNNNSDSEVSDREAFHSSKSNAVASQSRSDSNNNRNNSRNAKSVARSNNRDFDLFDNDDDDDDDFDQPFQKKTPSSSAKNSNLVRSSADSQNTQNNNNKIPNNSDVVSSKKNYNETQFKSETFDLAEDATTVQSTRHTTDKTQNVLRVSRDMPGASITNHNQSNLNNNVRRSKDNTSETLVSQSTNKANNETAELPKSDSGLSDIDKRLQALASYLESARANVVKV